MTDQSVEISFKPTAGVQSTSLIAYQSRGHCLVIAGQDVGLSIIEQLDVKAATLLVPGAAAVATRHQATEDGVKVVTVKPLLLSGYLGTFDCAVGDPESPGSLAKMVGVSLLGGFDTVLDLSDNPMISREVLPFGYYAPQRDESELRRAMAEIAELDGEFEKPKYFSYDAAICAHSRSGIAACTQCIDVCGAGAIQSGGDGIQVDPYLCQGCGSCATSCPSGAMTYAYPRPADAFAQLATLIQRHQSGAVDKTIVLFLDAEKGAHRLQAIADDLTPVVLPVAVEEVGSIGMDGWFCALAYGACAVIIDAPDKDGGMRRALASQIDIAERILAGMAWHGRIQMMPATDAAAINAAAGPVIATGLPAARFKTFGDKRQTIRLALDHIRNHQPAVHEFVDLPVAAAFGEISVDTDACTLCLACVTVCPSRALQDGETLPQLKLIESSCVQCGTCEQACPEDAITLTARYLYDSEQALKPKVLNEEKPFNCIVCNKPFATQQIIGRMMTKLAGHWMFEDDKSKRRLKMCEDCRVMDIFDSESGIDVHKS